MNIIDYLYVDCVASMIVLWLVPGGLVEKVYNALAFYCMLAVAAMIFRIMKDKQYEYRWF